MGRFGLISVSPCGSARSRLLLADASTFVKSTRVSVLIRGPLGNGGRRWLTDPATRAGRGRGRARELLTFKVGGAALKGAKAVVTGAVKGGARLAKGAIALITKGAKWILAKA
jgi:hypothetical protein